MFKLNDAPVLGKLDAIKTVGGFKLTLRVEDLRRERGGKLLGLLKFGVNTTVIHKNWVYLEDDGYRHTFANRLYGTKQTPGVIDDDDLISIYPQQTFEHDFLLYSEAVWGAWIGASSGGEVAGDEEPSAPPWAVPGLVMVGSPSIWAGAAGANKSTLMRLTAQSLRYGVDRVIPIAREEMGIWVNAEESPEEHTRQLGNVNAALGLQRTTPMYTLHARGMQIGDLVTRLDRGIRETGARHLFIDSLSRLAQGMNLNNNETATTLMDAFASFDVSTNWLGHSGHENRQRLSGSKHFENVARVMVLIQSRMSVGRMSPELFRGVRARVYKANGAVPTTPLYWSLDYHRQHGLMKAELSSEDNWPVLICDFVSGEGKKWSCRRRTWEGVGPDGSIRCSQHENEEREE